MTAPAPPANSTSPAAVGPPQPTPTYGPGGIFTISCAARIAAAPRDCLGIVVAASECKCVQPPRASPPSAPPLPHHRH